MRHLCIFAVLSLVGLLLACGTWHPEYPNVTKFPAAKPLAIDGVWEVKNKLKVRIDKGRMYTVADLADGTKAGSVLAYDIQPSDQPRRFSCMAESRNIGRKVFGYGPGEIELIDIDKFIHTTAPNPKTGLHRQIQTTYTLVGADDKRALAEMILFASPRPSDYLLLRAMKSIELDQELLLRILDRCESGQVCKKALEGISDPQILVELVLQHPKSIVRKAALERIENPDDLVRIAIEHKSVAMQTACLLRLTDSQQVARVASETQSNALARTALARLSKRQDIQYVAKHANLSRIRLEASLWLEETKSFSSSMKAADRVLDDGIRLHQVTLAIDQAMNSRSPSLAQLGLLAKHGRSTSKAIAAELHAFQNAIRLYKVALGHEPRSALATAKLALASTLHARQANVSLVATHRGFGGAIARIPKEAIVLASAAVAMDPKDPRIRGIRAWVLFVDYQLRRQEALVSRTRFKGQAERLKKIVADLDVAIEARVDLPRNLMHRCFSYYHLRDYKRALTDARAQARLGDKLRISAAFVQKLERLAKPKK